MFSQGVCACIPTSVHVYVCMHMSVICNGFVAIIHIPTNSTNQWCGSNLQLAVMSGSVALLQPESVLAFMATVTIKGPVDIRE